MFPLTVLNIFEYFQRSNITTIEVGADIQQAHLSEVFIRNKMADLLNLAIEIQIQSTFEYRTVQYSNGHFSGQNFVRTVNGQTNRVPDYLSERRSVAR